MSPRRTLSAQDGMWLWIESPETPMQVASLSIFKPEQPARAFVRRLVEEYRKHPATARPFNYLIHPRPAPLLPTCEVVDDVEIDYHLRHSALPQPGGQRELGILVSRLHSSPLDRRRPMWELHVIEGLQGNRFAVYLKTHHALFDGVAGLQALAESFSVDPQAPLPAPPWARPLPARPAGAAAAPGLLEQARRLPGAGQAVWRLARSGGAGANPLVGLFQAPRSPLNVPITPQRRVSTATVDLARVNALAKATGTTLNDIVLALCSAALRRYLLDLGALPERPLVAMCPVSVRTPDAHSEGNAVSMILASLATDEPDPQRRLTAIAASTQACKAHLRSLPKAALDAYSSLAMTPHLARQLVPGAASGARPVFNVVISNVPGPRQPLHAGGARAEQIFPMSLLFKNEALNITVLSYADQLNFGFTACRSALPHVQDVAVYTVEALEELERSVAERRAA